MTILNTAVFRFLSLSQMTKLKSYLGMSVLDMHVHECEVCVCRMDIIPLLWIDSGNFTVNGYF